MQLLFETDQFMKEDFPTERKPQIPMLVAICWLLCGAFAYAQTPIVKYFEVEGARSAPFHSVEQLPQGGYIAVGNAEYWGPVRIMLFRMNENGNTLWTKWYYPDLPDNRWSVRSAVAPDGGLFILTAATLSYGGTFNSVMRTNAQGDSIWNVVVSSTNQWASANLNDIVATPDGGCILAGAASYGGNPRLVKVSSAGAISWETEVAADIYTHFKSVSLTSDSGYIATGVNHNNMTGLTQLLVTKFNSVGTLVWSRTFFSGLVDAGDGKRAEGHTVAATPDSGCMVGGWVSDSGLVSGGSALLMRLNASGDSLWTKTYFRHPNVSIHANLFKITQLPSDQYMAFLHKAAGYTDAGATLLKLDGDGDSLWSQIGYDYRIMMNGRDGDGGVLFSGFAIGAGPGYWDNVAVFIRTTADGMYVSPQLWSPSNGASNVDVRPNLILRGTPHIVSSYRVQVARDSAFTNIVFDQSNVTNDTIQTTQLLPSTEHFWHVQSFGREGGHTQWSAVWSFTTQAGSSVEDMNREIPVSFSLEQNYPNPFNSTTRIRYDVPAVSQVRLTICNLLGQEVARLVDGRQLAGTHTVTWDAGSLPSGICFCRMEVPGFVQTRKILLLK